jgi:hypothetical protein
MECKFPKVLALVLSSIVAQPLSAKECESLDDARWAYDEKNHTLRLCIQEKGERLRCSTFPVQVYIDDGDMGYGTNPFKAL